MHPKRKATESDSADTGSDPPAQRPTTDEGATAQPLATNEAKPKAKRAAKPPPPPPGPVYDPATMRAPPLQEPGFRIISFNVAGLRALLKKDPDALKTLVANESPDLVCLQEHKLQDVHCDELGTTVQGSLPGWRVYWNCSREKKGYSGVAMLCKDEPLSVECGIGHDSHDGEGRVVTVEYPSFYVVNVYVPNSGEGLKRLDYRVGEWDPQFAAYLRKLEAKGKPVVVTGDLNCAAEEIDIHSPKTNLRSAGFTVEERTSFKENFLNNGFVDTFRSKHPGVVGYTYWGYRFNLRAKNKGWRLDYFLVSEGLADKVYDSFHLPDVMGSDHCPLGLHLKME